MERIRRFRFGFHIEAIWRGTILTSYILPFGSPKLPQDIERLARCFLPEIAEASIQLFIPDFER